MIKIKFPKEQKQQAVEDCIRYFAEERGEALGHLAAEQLIDYMLGLIGPVAYNQALADARSMMNERLQSLDDDLYSLEKRWIR
ncbi:MAG: hypothetical protein K0R57_4446 [Paenibacillaceae bacterium]|jgi:uncharacterized protein (DUF2164 family)|nr:hypothetical protein [Paenibacillaceae bacterium]